jgi:GTP cyclohydrolase I
MSSRGARAHGADTITDDYRGVFAHDSSARVEFLIKALGAPVATIEELG